MSDTIESVKRLVIGRPRSSRELKHQLLPKWMALPVFSSDPLSSVAYATEEMMLALSIAGAVAFSRVLPLSAAVGLLLAIVVVSYRQTVRAYPRGGGAFIVARENLGDIPGLTAASALLIDYTLTVSVSIAAGVAAISSAVPAAGDHKVLLALGFVALVTLANLRGVKEAGVLFAIPTYTFVTVMVAMIVVGIGRCVVSGCPQADLVTGAPEVEATLTLFLLLRAFSSGATALTGVEAISDGVPAFRYPQAKNAADTLGIMGVIAVSMFLGISFLAVATHATAFEGMDRTVTAQIADAVFGPGIGFILVQVVSAAILILAANTAYADFPRLASVLAQNRFLPRQFQARGDRLVFSNGILILGGFASLLLILFGAEVSRLIQLYVVGVFTSFTLSQTGMCRHTWRVRGDGWQRSLAINVTGAVTTGVVLVVVSITKFTHGAWIVIVAIPLLVLLMARVHRHYLAVSLELSSGIADLEPRRRNHAIVLDDRVDTATARAVSYARAVAPSTLHVLNLGEPSVDEAFAALAPDVARLDLPREGDVVDELGATLRAEARRHPGDFTTAIVPETLSRSYVELFRRHRLALRVKTTLVGGGELVVANVTAPAGEVDIEVEEPVEHHVVVLVSAVNLATRRAIAYAEGLQGSSLRALSVNLDSEHSSRLLHQWEDYGVGIPLELVDSPFRTLGDSVREYVRSFAPDGRHTVVTCVLPEFVVARWWHRPLHNQTALLIKGALLFELGVVTTSVPYHLETGARAGEVPAAAERA